MEKQLDFQKFICSLIEKTRALGCSTVIYEQCLREQGLAYSDGEIVPSESVTNKQPEIEAAKFSPGDIILNKRDNTVIHVIEGISKELGCYFSLDASSLDIHKTDKDYELVSKRKMWPR